MTKEQREKVWKKYNHRCAYCGNTIEYKNLQVDHLHPKSMEHFIGKGLEEHFGVDIQHIDDIKNLMPSCRRCNYYKHNFRLEDFRKEIFKVTERLQKVFIFKLAVSFGIIEIKSWDGKFYFERNME